MSIPLKLFISALLIGLSVYFLLIWHGDIKRPNGLPVDTDNELDPATCLVGVAMAGLLWIEDIKTWLGRRKQ